MTPHATIWIDHKEAKVFHLSEADFDEKTLHAPKAHFRSSGGKSEKHSDPAMETFFGEVAKSVADAAEVLVVGPGPAKLEFIRHVHKHAKALEPKIVGVETVDHPTDRQVVAYARDYYRAHDRREGKHVF